MRGTVVGMASPRPMGPAMPALYQEDPFALGFLDALDTVLAPVMGTLDNLDTYFDPYLTPDDFLAWLATWVGMTVDDSWTIERRREAVARAVELYRLRGTATGLQEQIEIHTGGTVEIIENGGTAWSIDPGGELPGSAFHVRNDAGEHGFSGAAPPEGDQVHRYIFAVHAVGEETLGVDENASPAVVSFNLAFKAIGRALLIGTYQF